MSTEGNLGKLALVGQSLELNFCLNPSQFTLDKNYQYEVNGALGNSTPHVAFRSGGARVLNVTLDFDRDVDEAFSADQVTDFISQLDSIEDETQSPSSVKFEMGAFSFEGVCTQYRYSPLRFMEDLTPTRVQLSLTLFEQKGGSA